MSIRILYLEDNTNDRELLRSQLKDAKLEHELAFVDSKEDFLKQLTAFQPDIIISDYILPQFSGLEALKIIKGLSLDIPFVILTGSINEETAVACLKAGAYDYVLKGHLIKIPQTIETTLISFRVKREIKLAEERLLSNRKKYSQLIENTGVPIFSIDSNGKCLVLNNLSAQYLGGKTDDFIGKTLWDVFSKEFADTYFANIKSVISTGIEINHDISTVLRGKMLWFNTHILPITNMDGTINSVQIIAHDITERKINEEQALIQNKIQWLTNNILELSLQNIALLEIFNRVLDQIFAFSWLELTPKAAIYIMKDDPAYIILAAHKGLTEEDVSSSQKIPVRDCSMLQTLVRDNIGHIEPLKNCGNCFFKGVETNNAYCMPIVSSGKLLGVLKFGFSESQKDVAKGIELIRTVSNVLSSLIQRKNSEKEKELMQAQLVQSSKMSALGQMAAGVAHELNNPMTVIMGNAQFLLADKSLAAQHEVLNEVENAAQRCKKIIFDLLEFSRKKDFELKELELAPILDQVLRLAEYQSEFKSVTITKKIAADLKKIRGSASHLEQLFFNIVINASQAMPGGGKLDISMSNAENRKSVDIAFTDSGKGIAPDLVNRIFEPFFTTKTKGTGLGLAISYNIVSQHGGDIRVSSPGIGMGTTFTITLPSVG